LSAPKSASIPASIWERRGKFWLDSDKHTRPLHQFLQSLGDKAEAADLIGGTFLNGQEDQGQIAKDDLVFFLY
jgi:hypothetical protein